MCKQGYCRYPMSTIHVQPRKCRAEVPNSSCTFTRVCWKGGLLSTSCDRGYCLCRTQMHIGLDGQCHPGWDPEILLGMNETERAATALDEETIHEENIETAFNVAFATALVTFPAVLAVSGAMLSRRKLRSTRGDGSEYKELPSGAAVGSPVTA